MPDLDTAQVDTGDLAEKRTGGNLDTHGRVCDVRQIHVVEVETEQKSPGPVAGRRKKKERKKNTSTDFHCIKNVSLNYK